MSVRVSRLVDGPIISPDLHPSIGVNIQGPSLIRMPDWVEGRIGAYYLYFADHKVSYIRLAYSDVLTGPWRVHPPGRRVGSRAGGGTTGSSLMRRLSSVASVIVGYSPSDHRLNDCRAASAATNPSVTDDKERSVA
jgi:hypothetical protein